MIIDPALRDVKASYAEIRDEAVATLRALDWPTFDLLAGIEPEVLSVVARLVPALLAARLFLPLEDQAEVAAAGPETLIALYWQQRDREIWAQAR